jgi:hypothetical protein
MRGEPIGWVRKLIEAIYVVDDNGAVRERLEGRHEPDLRLRWQLFSKR